MRPRRSTLLSLCLLGVTGCATVSPSAPTPCDSFATFDAEAQQTLERLLAEAEGERLVSETARIQAARRQCAKEILAGLLQRREVQGVESVQRELDALTAAYSDQTLSALLGDRRAALQPLLAEARQRLITRHDGTSFERTLPAQLTPHESLEQHATVSVSSCGDPLPCEQVRCLLEHQEPVTDAANACFQHLELSPPQQHAQRLAELAQLLEGTPRDEALQRLTVLWRSASGQLADARAKGQWGLAAERAAPFAAVPALQAQVNALHAAAAAHHLGRAAQGGTPEVKWLHARLAEQFGGPKSEALPTTGTWDPVRWRCEGAPPEFPALPAGWRAQLTVRCPPPPRAATQRAAAPPETFELEQSMAKQRASVTLELRCAGERFTVELTHVPGEEWGPLLEGALERTRPACQRRVVERCPRAPAQDRGETITRFVQLGTISGSWAPCFTSWLQAVEGTSPPPLPRPAAAP